MDKVVLQLAKQGHCKPSFQWRPDGVVLKVDNDTQLKLREHGGLALFHGDDLDAQGADDQVMTFDDHALRKKSRPA